MEHLIKKWMIRGIPIKGNLQIYLAGGFNHLENISQWEGLSHI